MKFEIKKRFTSEVLLAGEFPAEYEKAGEGVKLGAAVKLAVKARVDLAHADLGGVNLAHASLASAKLMGANLVAADLSHADLSHADLSQADLTRANLVGANLTRAYLAGTDLAHACFAGANLSHAYLAHAYVGDTDLGGACLEGADLADAITIAEKDVPVIPMIDAVILKAIEAGGALEMSSWHGHAGSCGTTHCRAGWAVHCAGKRGRALEQRIGTHRAGAMIYRASRPGIPTPWFFAPTEDAMADIRNCAAAVRARAASIA